MPTLNKTPQIKWNDINNKYYCLCKQCSVPYLCPYKMAQPIRIKGQNYLLYNPIFVLETLVVIDVCADFMFHEHVCIPSFELF